MEKIDLQIKQNDNTLKDFAENVERASNTNDVTKEEILQKLIGKHVLKCKR